MLLPGGGRRAGHAAKRGTPTRLVTGATRDRLARELPRLGVDNGFATVIGHDDIVRKKPDPEGIEKALRHRNVGPGNCCYVGDAPDDIRMGRSAGVGTIGVRTEYVDPARLEECGADHVLHSIAGLPAILEGGSTSPRRR